MRHAALGVNAVRAPETPEPEGLGIYDADTAHCGLPIGRLALKVLGDRLDLSGERPQTN